MRLLLAVCVPALFFCAEKSLAGGKETGGWKIIDSVIFGAAYHNGQSNRATGTDLNLELRSGSLLDLPESLKLMPTLGGTVPVFNPDGAAFGYFGATLQYQHDSGIFAEGFFGISVHDADIPTDADEVDLGCRILFREAAEIGYAWGHHQLGANIAHYSHGNMLCGADENQGLTQMGLRYGYRF